MHVSRLAFLFLLLATFPVNADVTIQSGPGRVHLLELFTSEGCSSCPPAEHWFSALRQNPRLWKEIVPMAFHVDYWDNLGWKDQLAAPAFTARQRRYAGAWGTGTVYTPGFVLDGREWRGRDLDSLGAPGENAGMLSATLRESGEVLVTFHSAAKNSDTWQAYAALLGFGLNSDVKAGENSGRKLRHDFAVLATETAAVEDSHATLRLPLEKAPRGQFGFAVWITEKGGIEPVQAAGGAR